MKGTEAQADGEATKKARDDFSCFRSTSYFNLFGNYGEINNEWKYR